MYVIHKQSTKFMFTALLTLRDIEVSGHNTDLGFKELSPCSHLAGKDPVIPQVWDLIVGVFFAFCLGVFWLAVLRNHHILGQNLGSNLPIGGFGCYSKKYIKNSAWYINFFFFLINNLIGSLRRTENLIGHIIYWDSRNSLWLLMYLHGKQES